MFGRQEVRVNNLLSLWMYTAPILGTLGALVIWATLAGMAALRLRRTTPKAARWFLVAGVLGTLRVIVVTPLVAATTALSMQSLAIDQAMQIMGVVRTLDVIGGFVPWVLLLVGLWKISDEVAEQVSSGD